MASTPVDIRGFKGINIREPAGMIQDDELSECLNFNIGRAGELVKRDGFSILHTGVTLGSNDSEIIGHYLTNSVSHLLVKANGNLYYSTNGADLTLIGAYDVDFGVQYGDVFYMVRAASTIVTWDGSAAATLVGSPTGTFCTVYKDRLYVLNSESATVPSRLYFSSIADFATWPSTNFIDIKKGDGDFLTCCAVIHDLLVVFKGQTTWGLYVSGPPENWLVRNHNPAIGCISKYTTKEIEGFLYFVGSRGIYKTDGNLFEDISSSIQPIFTDRIVNITNANIDTAAWWDDKYIVLLHPTPSTSRYFAYHLRTGGWTEWEFAGGVEPGTFKEILSNEPSKGLYAGDLAGLGRIYRLNVGAYTDAGSNFTCRAVTKIFDFAAPTLMKRGLWGIIDVDTEGSIELIHTVNEDAQVAQSVDAGTSRRGIKIPGPGYFRTWGMSISLVNDAAATLYGISLWLILKRSLIKEST